MKVDLSPFFGRGVKKVAASEQLQLPLSRDPSIAGPSQVYFIGSLNQLIQPVPFFILKMCQDTVRMSCVANERVGLKSALSQHQR